VTPRYTRSLFMKRSKRDTIYHQRTQLSLGSGNYTSDYEIEEKGDIDTGGDDLNFVKYIY
jgi:hypothetical protein